METKHTETPWKATHIGEGEFRQEIIIDIATCGQIAIVLDTGNGKANTAFIAKAANSHDKLVEALRVLVDHAAETYPHFESERGQRDLAAARAALAEAEKEQP